MKGGYMKRLEAPYFSKIRFGVFLPWMYPGDHPGLLNFVTLPWMIIRDLIFRFLFNGIINQIIEILEISKG
uniref:Uncharacterized protein n=1 Tax=Rhizophagus irregularis (strain DAOM 181602 / DAOM 197198 / MUCL 43194) TaxID=747089 RepID=U9UTA0_RHIID